jgi:hypothetical protein
MEADVQALIGVNSHMTTISLNADLARIEEAGTIDDENQEHRNIKRFKRITGHGGSI